MTTHAHRLQQVVTERPTDIPSWLLLDLKTVLEENRRLREAWREAKDCLRASYETSSNIDRAIELMDKALARVPGKK